MISMNAFEIAKQRSESQGGGGSAQFFSLKEGETATLRFLTGLIPYYVVGHSCGITGADMIKENFDAAIASGEMPKCPGCGQPLTMDDVLYERPDCVGADLHNFMPLPAEPDKKGGSFVCLASKTNALFGNVPVDEMGEPKYQCPVCSCAANISKQTGKPKAPTFRLYGLAVMRNVVMGSEVINGVPTPVVSEVKDVMVEEEGKEHPKVVIVNMSYNNFWQKLGNWDSNYERSICNYDWRVTRIGSGLQTTYDLQTISDKPTVVDMRQYQEWMPDLRAIVAGMGNPEYYVKKGYAVPGYQAAAQPQTAVAQASVGIAQAAQAVQAQPQQMQAQPMGIPAQGMPTMAMPAQTATGNDWSVVQGQFS